jgi:hypothetical protein
MGLECRRWGSQPNVRLVLLIKNIKIKKPFIFLIKQKLDDCGLSLLRAHYYIVYWPIFVFLSEIKVAFSICSVTAILSRFFNNHKTGKIFNCNWKTRIYRRLLLFCVVFHPWLLLKWFITRLPSHLGLEYGKVLCWWLYSLRTNKHIWEIYMHLYKIAYKNNLHNKPINHRLLDYVLFCSNITNKENKLNLLFMTQQNVKFTVF